MNRAAFSLALAAAAALTFIMPLSAQEAPDPERLAEFIAVIEDNGCEFAASYEGTAFLRDAGFRDGVEVNALRRELVGSGLAEFDGQALTLKTENCG